jgi:23S rRNA pseudouridine2457 synthase
MLHYYLIYKPFGMLSQFTPDGDHPVLRDLYPFPKDVYAVGRLDTDSEGLLLLTDDTRVNARLLDPRHAHERTYYAQVEGSITEEACAQLRAGVSLRIDGKEFRTQPAKAVCLEAPMLPERNPPIRHRASIPTSWLSLTLREGKNRQVRRMTAAVGFPTLRLVRVSIGAMALGQMQPGEVRQIEGDEVWKELRGL